MEVKGDSRRADRVWRWLMSIDIKRVSTHDNGYQRREAMSYKLIKVVPTQTGAEVYSVPENVLLGVFNDAEATFTGQNPQFTEAKQLMELSTEMQRRFLKKSKSSN
jgi:hypothetical protein